MRYRCRLLLSCALLSLFALAACSKNNLGSRSFAAIEKRGTLVVLTRNAPTTWYIGNNGRPTGPEYRMVLAFAESIGVKPRFVVKDSVAGLLRSLKKGEGDLIAAGITRTAAREKTFDFGPVYQKVTQEVVCGRGGEKPHSLSDLASVHLTVIADSSYDERLRRLQRKFPDLRWKTTARENTETLLRKVWAGQLDCTVADSNIVAINRRYFPNLVPTLKITQPQPLAWVVRKKGSQALRDAMRRWLRRYRSSGSLEALMAHYYGHAHIFNFVDVRALKRKIETVWPRYRAVFENAADRYGLSPLILAAVAYQESRWNPRAIGPGGARGMMMITLATARSLGLKNRLDATQSILAGARYLAHLENKLDAVPRGERIWFALAAYNIGLYHLHDARALARRLGKNPDRWHDVSQVLPLLSRKRYYRHLHYGYVRGLRAVRYVRHVRTWADILRRATRGSAARDGPAPAVAVSPRATERGHR